MSLGLALLVSWAELAVLVGLLGYVILRHSTKRAPTDDPDDTD